MDWPIVQWIIDIFWSFSYLKNNYKTLWGLVAARPKSKMILKSQWSTLLSSGSKIWMGYCQNKYTCMVELGFWQSKPLKSFIYIKEGPYNFKPSTRFFFKLQAQWKQTIKEGPWLRLSSQLGNSVSEVCKVCGIRSHKSCKKKALVQFIFVLYQDIFICNVRWGWGVLGPAVR